MHLQNEIMSGKISNGFVSLQEKCTSSVMAAVSSSNTEFALDLLRTLSQANPTGNIFVSPLSISSALAMVYLGARGNTAVQMAQVSTLSVCLSFSRPPSPDISVSLKAQL